MFSTLIRSNSWQDDPAKKRVKCKVWIFGVLILRRLDLDRAGNALLDESLRLGQPD